ncbi:FAD-dependent oxidoreductase [Pelagibacterium sediminicola]|uniref:FAD-dependent oxidoreductase n=1 Tax=Pelagibacterium sediminicola TaxID=2248761 RepID=UPI0013008910|nr:FAD-dependent oxidoreductase [Pelagibacterium sediminicola]
MIDRHYDVVVVGGGSAGVAAAVGAARSGARTLLVERYGFLGGAATGSNVLAYCGFWTSTEVPLMGVRGVGARVLETLAELGANAEPIRNRTGNWIVMLDPEALKHALDGVVAEAGVEVLLHTRVVDAVATDEGVEAITIQDHGGRRQISADAFVDASGDANLVRLASAPLSQPERPFEQRPPASFPVRIGGISRDAVWDRAEIARSLDDVTNDYPDARIRSDGGGIFKLPDSGDHWWLGIDILTDGLTGASLTRAEQVGRDLAWRAVARLKKSVPAFADAYIASTGPQAGIRASEQAAPRLGVSGEDVLMGRKRDDGIACGCWPAEVHHGLDGAEYRPVGGDRYYHIPFDSLRPRNLDNLWIAGRVIGCADEIAYGSIRVMGTAFATGHAAGISAALSASGGEKVSAPAVRGQLLAQGAFL